VLLRVRPGTVALVAGENAALEVALVTVEWAALEIALGSQQLLELEVQMRKWAFTDSYRWVG